MNARQRRKQRRFLNRIITFRDIEIQQFYLDFVQRLRYLFKPDGHEPKMLVTGKCNITAKDKINYQFGIKNTGINNEKTKSDV